MQKRNWKELFATAAGNCLGLIFAVAFYFILLRFSQIWEGISKGIGILMPFVTGSVLAYLLKTPCNFFEKLYQKHLPEKLKTKKNGMAVFTVLLLAFLIVYTILRSILPQLIASITTLSKAVPGVTREFFDWLDNYLNSDGIVQSYIRPIVESLSVETMKWADGALLPELQGVVENVTTTLTSIVGVAGNMIISFIVCVYALSARKTFARQGKAVVYSIFPPNTADKIMDEMHFIDATFDGFISGKVLDSVIVGLICYVFCVILSFTRGFTNGILISLIVGLTNIIPYFGPFIGAIPSIILIAVSDPVNAVIFLIFIIILQQFDGNVLGPKLLAGSVGLSGFWVLFSITLFSGIFGFVGVLIGVPVFAVIYDLIKKYVLKGLHRHGKLDILQQSRPTTGEEEKK